MELLSADLHEWIASVVSDFTVWSWVINIAYILSFILTIFFIRRIRNLKNKELRFLWICIAAVLLLLGINKQLNFQTLLIIVGRSLADKQDWVENIRKIQALFTAVFCLGIAVTGTLVLFRIRRVLSIAWIEITGIALLSVFTIIRAGSINHVGKVEKVANMFNHIHAIELAGILIIVFAMFRHYNKLLASSASSDRSPFSRLI
jgi:hypothetical protein